MLACSADCPADNHARQLPLFLCGTFAKIKKTKVKQLFCSIICIASLLSVKAQIVSRDTIRSPDNMIVQKIFYMSDSLKVNGYILEPKGGSNFPVIISNRGGSFDYGALNDTTAIEWNKFLVNAGYMVFASNYRGNMGSEGKEEWGSGDVRDVLNFFEIIDNYPRADSSNIGMYGWSRGGMVTFNALRKTNRLNAAVIGGEDGNIYEDYYHNDHINDYFERVFSYMWPDELQMKSHLKSISAYYFIEELNPTPLLLLHGTGDKLSSAKQALKTLNKLIEKSYPVSFKLYHGSNHGLDEYTSEVDRDIIEWFDRYLK